MPIDATGMIMPETPMYKNYGLVLGEYDVGLAREVLSVKPETEACAVECGPKGKLRRRVA